MDEKEREILRALPAAARIATAMRLYWSARQVKAAALRAAHPDWSDEAIDRQVRERFLHARD